MQNALLMLCYVLCLNMEGRMENLKKKLSQFEIKQLQGVAEGEAVTGSGSFGAVYRVDVKGVPRTVKRLHNILLAPDVQQLKRIIQGTSSERPEIKNSIILKSVQVCRLLHRY